MEKTTFAPIGWPTVSRRQIQGLVSRALRRLQILEYADTARCRWSQLKSYSENKRFLAEHPDFPVPPAHIAYDVDGAVSWPAAYERGRSVAAKLVSLLAQFSDLNAGKVLDWGCGPAFVSRYLRALLPVAVQLYASDYNKETILWCKKHIGGITFSENDLLPPLPFDDKFFDCIYSLSVLTHLSEANCQLWLAELSRVLKPKGILFVTTKGESNRKRLLPGEIIKMDKGKPVIRGCVPEGKRMYDTIIPETFFRSIIPNSLTLREFHPFGMPVYDQDLWILQKQGGDVFPEGLDQL